jgi:hypothetical protein
MQAHDMEPAGAATALLDDDPAETLGAASSQLREILGRAEETARGMLEAEEALRLVRERLERTADAATRGELAAQALVHVERQLHLTRERRRQLDSTEAKLWARQNCLEGFLIKTRGSAWWHARRGTALTDTVATGRTGSGR